MFKKPLHAICCKFKLLKKHGEAAICLENFLPAICITSV